jgi:hypothetical protein
MRLPCIFSTVCAATIVLSFAPISQGQGQEVPRRPLPRGDVEAAAKALDEERLWPPITDYASASEAKLDAKRVTKSRLYNGMGLVPSRLTELRQIYENSHGSVEGLPALPVTECEAIVVGEITEAEAYLSDDISAVYSEYRIQVSKVLKGASHVEPGGVIYADREGGSVRYPDGSILRVVWSSMSIPRVGSRYLFFLRETPGVSDYRLGTLYELGANDVQPLDRTGRDISSLDFAGWKPERLVKLVERLIRQPERRPDLIRREMKVETTGSGASPQSTGPRRTE